MKVSVSLNLFAVCLDAGLCCLLRLFDDSFKLSEVIVGNTAKAQLNSQQVESIDKSENLGVVFRGPATDIKAARRSTTPICSMR